MAFGAAFIVRRGVEFTHATLSDPPNGGERPKMPKISAWAALLVILTILGFSALFFAVQYSFCQVVATLTMIESNQSDAYVAVDTLPSNDDENDDEMPKPPSSDPLLEPEVLMKNTPITTSIRRTIHHLRTHYGSVSPFRGLNLFICLSFARLTIIQFFGIPPFMNNWLGFSIASILTDLLLARWEMTWIHIVISEPTPGKKWWRRALPLSSWVKIAPAVALASVAKLITNILTIIVGLSFGAFKRMTDPNSQVSRSDLNAACAQSFFVFILAIILTILIVLPASVVLVRVAASMLPEENETVVPFDRSFGGKVTPAIIGGQGRIGMVEAWKSFDWSSRVRLVKLVVKVVGITIALCLFAVMVTVGEAHLIIGSKNMKEIMKFVAERLGRGH